MEGNVEPSKLSRSVSVERAGVRRLGSRGDWFGDRVRRVGPVGSPARRGVGHCRRRRAGTARPLPLAVTIGWPSQEHSGPLFSTRSGAGAVRDLRLPDVLETALQRPPKGKRRPATSKPINAASHLASAAGEPAHQLYAPARSAPANLVARVKRLCHSLAHPVAAPAARPPNAPSNSGLRGMTDLAPQRYGQTHAPPRDSKRLPPAGKPSGPRNALP